MNQNITNVRIDLAAPYTELFLQKQKEFAGRYVPDEAAYRRSVEVYLLFRRLAWDDWGVVEDIAFDKAKSVTFTTRIYSAECDEKSLQDFIKLLELADHLEADCPPEAEMLILKVRVDGIWKKVNRKIIELY